MSNMKYVLGIDIGGTHIRMGMVDPEGAISAYATYDTALLLADPAKTPMEVLISLIRGYLTEHAVLGSPVAVCAGFPASVDKKRECICNAPNLPGLDGLNVKQILSEGLGLPAWIERDVNLLICSDVKDLKQPESVIVACYVGTGLGNTILLDGKLWIGAHGVAAELGHILYGDSTVICGCGNEGCSEPLVGGRYLAQIAKEAFGGASVGSLFVEHGTHPLLAQYVDRLARVIATEINLIDPSRLILGGGVIDMEGFPKARLEALIRKYCRKPLPEADLVISYSDSHGGRCGVIGAGLYAWKQLNEASNA